MTEGDAKLYELLHRAIEDAVGRLRIELTERLERIERRIDTHNHFAERLARAEEAVSELKHARRWAMGALGGAALSIAVSLVIAALR